MKRKAHMSGLFDWLRKAVPPLPGSQSQLPIVRESTLPAVPRKEEKKLSLFSFLSPEAKEKKSLIPSPAFFQVLTPPPAPPEPVQEEKPRQLWENMFTPSQGEEVPVGEMFQFLKPETVQEAARYVTHPEDWPYKEPPLWEFTRWHMPTTYELAQFIQQKWDLPGLYERVLAQADSRWWRQQVENSAHTGEPAEMDVDLVSVYEPPYTDMTKFLNIPEYVIEQYGLYGQEGLERFTVEVLQPLLERVGKALDVFRPSRQLRGWFELEPDDRLNFWLKYKEGKFSPQL